MKSKKIKIAQQVLNPNSLGGVSSEFKSLIDSKLKSVYEFVPIILKEVHKGINIDDIMFYYSNIKEQDPDIVHIRGSAVDGLNAVIAAKLLHKPSILVSVHGMYSDLIYISKFKRFVSKYIIETLIYSLCDGISCVCKSSNDRIYFKRYKNKMLPFVYNRIPEYIFDDFNLIRTNIRERNNIPKNAIVGIYCGRITKEKGLQILKEAFFYFDESWPTDFYFFIVGNGDYYIELINDLSKLKHRCNIIFTGEQTSIRDYLFSSDFFVQPSLHENHSIALLEACAAHIPSIATNVGGNNEIVKDKEYGIIIDKSDVNQLIDAIKKMINDNEFRFFCKKNLEASKFQQFSNEEVDSKMQLVYELLLKRKLVKYND